MAEAEDASLRLQRYDEAEGERRFKELLSRYPDDGMVYFKRGVAYEAIGRPERAQEDYSQAEALFPMREWKNLAREGIKRCTIAVRLSKVPREVRAIWRDVVRMQDCPRRARTMTARAAVERTADLLTRELQLTARGVELKSKLATLGGSRKIDKRALDDMGLVKELGDAAAHGQDISDVQAERCFEAVLRIIAFLTDQPWRR